MIPDLVLGKLATIMQELSLTAAILRTARRSDIGASCDRLQRRIATMIIEEAPENSAARKAAEIILLNEPDDDDGE